jgi:ATP-dependent exoDNAse (exonuclease V) beta subunit
MTADRSVVVANAGSGKTYLLANRVVRWMLAARGSEGPSAPEDVLAITFTRKAAGEIVERVLLHLAQGASSEAKRREFAAEGQVGEFGAAEYAAALDRFIDALHRVSISTIDGFFVQLAGAFAPELAMPEDWRIGDDDELDALRAEAVGAVIAADPARAVELARRIGDGAPKPQVQSAIDDVLEDALDLWMRAGLHGDPRAPWERSMGGGRPLFPCAARATERELEDAVEGLATAPVPAKYERNWKEAVARVRALAAAGDWFALLDDSLLRALQGKGLYYKQEPPPELERWLSVVRAHACAEVERAVRERAAATADLAALVSEALDAARRRSGTYGFGDVAALLAQANALGGEGLQRMHERLDRMVRDLAFDEFQDTSPAQWAVVRPLVDEIAAGADRRLLVVGDPKQSIYAWRGGTPALLAAVEEEERLDADVTLATSFRSSPVVLAFVNDLFEPLAARLAGAPLDEAPAGAAAALRGARLDVTGDPGRSPLARALDAWPFTLHAAAPRNASMPGAVHAYVVPGTGGDVQAAGVADIVASRVRERPGATIGVLVSTNAEVADCVSAIRALGIDVSDEGRSPLVDSAAVVVLLSLLRVAEHPLDTLAHFLATREPACALLGLVPMERHGGGAPLQRAARELSGRVRASLLEHGLAGWVERHASMLRPACSRNDAERLRQLTALAHEASPAMAASPGDFVRAVESRRSRTGEEARVRVMTVHASKGLEFDEVVVGSTGRAMGRLAAGPGEWVALAPDPLAGPTAVAPVAPLQFCDFSPLLAAFRAEATVLRLSDDLSALYVAVTRAREAVHLVCPPRSKDDEPKVTAAWILRRAFDGFEQAMQAHAPDATKPAERVWTYEPAEGLPSGALPARPEPVASSSERPQALAVDYAPRPVAVRAPSAHEAPEGRFFEREFAGEDDGTRGTLAHAWFERITWLDDGDPRMIEPAEVMVAASVDAGRPIDAELARTVRTLVDVALTTPMADVLRRTRCASWGCDALEVHVEMPFALATEDGLVRGRMDRVVLGLRGGRVERAEVVDWKTGARGVSGAELDQRIDPYRKQMAAYRAALAAMFGLAPERVTAVLAMVDRGELIEA